MSHDKILLLIMNCSDEKQLLNWIANARKLKETEVEQAAMKRLIAVKPQEEVGSLEWDFWRTIFAFEFMLSDERGRTTRLSRTRQKVARDGVQDTLSQWALDKNVTEGFTMLIERQMPELLGEAIILRHPQRFNEAVKSAAQRRLVEAGVDIDALPARPGT